MPLSPPHPAQLSVQRTVKKQKKIGSQITHLFSSDGSLTRWDLRKANTPVAAIRIGQGPLRQIALKPSTTGFIHAGGANGSLSAVDVDCSRITWVMQ